MKSYRLRALRARLSTFANWLSIPVSTADAPNARFVFHPMGVVRIVTPDEAAARPGQPKA